jgi:plasmid segregation protein ParM
MKEPIVWAYDDGYGDNKLFDGERELLIPSVVSQWRPKMKQEIQVGKIAEPYSYITALVDGKKYLIGEGAVQQDTTASANLRSDKHNDKLFPIMLKACLGLLATEEQTFVDVLVMGLPVEAEEMEGRHKILQDMILGLHHVELTLADGTVLNREFHIKELMIKKQPFGSQCDIMLDMEGELSNEEVAGGFNVIADVGAGTFNCYTLNALQPIKDLSFNTFDGMYRAYEEVNEKIAEELGQPTQDAKLPSLINKEGKIQDLDLSEFKEDAYDNLANTVVGIVEKRMKNSWSQIKRIIWTGGGGDLLKGSIEKYMPNRNKIFLGRFSTVRGLWKLGKRHIKNKTATKAKVEKKESEPTSTV